LASHYRFTHDRFVPGFALSKAFDTIAQRDFNIAYCCDHRRKLVGLKAGFVVNDIQIVANKKFLAENPAAKQFFELFKLPLDEISEQNAKMEDGEKSQNDIERHAEEWIASHQETWNGWLDAARQAVQ
jgi:ABC-type proline/glycine betaine transport system substrate-binding protein